jgi:hypothetical protein
VNLRELEYIVAIADHGQFGRAAEACHVSQSTLSIQVKKVEDEIGVAIFERDNRRVLVTPVGERIVAKARDVLREAGCPLHPFRRPSRAVAAHRPGVAEDLGAARGRAADGGDDPADHVIPVMTRVLRTGARPSIIRP